MIYRKSIREIPKSPLRMIEQIHGVFFHAPVLLHREPVSAGEIYRHYNMEPLLIILIINSGFRQIGVTIAVAFSS